MATFKVTFSLDEDDARYYRDLYRKAKRCAKDLDTKAVLREAREIVRKVRANRKTPSFVVEAIEVLADLADLIQDEQYDAPKKVRDEVLTAIAYFSNPEDLIPDHLPALGFLDDAIMVRFIEDEFQHELWGYRSFRKLRDSAEQRPWSAPGRQRLQQRLEADRKRIRGQIETRQAKDAIKKKTGRRFGW